MSYNMKGVFLVVHRSSYFDGFGLVESLSRSDYERNLLDWVYEDDIESEGIIIVSNRFSGELRYVVVDEMPVMRAVIPFSGEILEITGDLSMKRLYRFALRHAKDELRNDDVMGVHDIEVLFSVGAYSAYEYLNTCGYMQRDFIKRGDISCIRVSVGENGYKVERG